MTRKSVLVYSEDDDILSQLSGKGKELADELDGELVALMIGSGVQGNAEEADIGAARILVADDPGFEYFSVEPCRAAFLKAVELVDPYIILIGATKRGKELAARVAAALDTGCMTECVSLNLDREGRLVAERLTYGGSTVATEVSGKAPHIATVPARVFKESEPSGEAAEIVGLSVEVPEARVRVLERREKKRGDMGLDEAPVIVSAGRGFKEEADLSILKNLAEVLGAKMGCTRPIAADLGWMEEWVGISGHKVSPKLYLACGISGTIQHAAGIRDAQLIVSINEAEAANIHELSDYSIVGDLYRVLPALTKALKEKIG
ncbi:MAG: electron transfer flavoprotein subunit alpha/FixB family protein [Candidatus Bathyarchaeota archaeon]